MDSEQASGRKPNVLRRLYAWTKGWAQHPSATWALFLIAFAESSFFPIPPDPLLIALCAVRPRSSLWFALVCTLGSVSGGILGYGIGYTVHDPARQFLDWLAGREAIDLIEIKYRENAFWLLIAKSFTPVPYKVFSISAGIFGVNPVVFVVASLIGRGVRFFGIGTIMIVAGPRLQVGLERYIEVFSAAFLVLLVAGFLAIKYLAF